jgi:predicted transcriptional regulator
MSTLSVQIPNSLHTHLQELAESEGITVEQFIATAVAEKMAALMTESYLTERAKRGSRAKYETALAQVPDVEPEKYDRLSPSENQ